jgi:hypothetical protein
VTLGRAHYWFALSAVGAAVAVLNALFGSVAWVALFGGGALIMAVRGIYAVAGVEGRYVDPGAVIYVVGSIGLVGVAVADLAGAIHPAGGSPTVGAVLLLVTAACAMFVGLHGLGVIRISRKNDDQTPSVIRTSAKSDDRPPGQSPRWEGDRWVLDESVEPSSEE